MIGQILDIPDTPDIFLRPISLDDIQPLYDLIVGNREHLKAYQSWAETATLESTQERVRSNLDKIHKNEFLQFRIISRSEPRYAGIVGMVTFHNKQENIKAVLLGYWMEKTSQGKGHAYASVNRAIEYVFSDWDMEYVILEIDPANKRSEKLAARLGAWPSDDFSALDGDGEEYRSKVWVITR